jgi:hypothetical protein
MLTRPILYRGFDLNDAAAQVGRPGLLGCSVDAFDISPLTTMQYIDKAYQHDGMDFQGVGNLSVMARSIDLRGTLYGETRGDLWDRLMELRQILDPVQSYADDEVAQGFLPLSWTLPTGAAGATVGRFINARPEGIRDVFNRDRHGTAAKVSGKADMTALALQWTCQFRVRDPRVYGVTHTVDLSATPSGTVTNAGDYPGLFDLSLVLPGTAGVRTVGLSGKTITMNIAAGTSGRIVRYRGLSRLLTLEDSALSSEEILRQDLLDFTVKDSDTQHPLFLEGANAYSVSGTILAGSMLVCSDAYA